MILYYDRFKDDIVCELVRVRNVNECVKKKEKVILFFYFVYECMLGIFIC